LVGSEVVVCPPAAPEVVDDPPRDVVVSTPEVAVSVVGVSSALPPQALIIKATRVTRELQRIAAFRTPKPGKESLIGSLGPA
jgi:hypothetical protein